MQNITDTRMSATSHRTLVMFGELSGFEDASRVVIVTTMWDTLIHNTAAKKREDAFKLEYWDVLMHHGATIARFLGVKEQESTWKIINNVINIGTQRTGLQFQHERVDQKIPLQQTSANKTLTAPVSILPTLVAKQKMTKTHELTTQDSGSSSTPNR